MKTYSPALLACLTLPALAHDHSLLTQPADQTEAQPTDQPDATQPTLQNSAERTRLTGVSLIWENDGRYFNLYDDTDRWYTNGTKLDFSFSRPWPGPFRRLLPFQYDNAREAGGFSTTQQIFTPEDITEPELITDDRPYAGELTFGLYAQRAGAHHFDHLEFDVGVVGEWAGGEAAQKFVHSILPDQVDPAGWDNQLSNELTLNFTYEHRMRTGRADVFGLDLDAIGALGFRVGNAHVDMNAGVTGRFGYNLPDDYGPGTVQTFRDATGTWADDFGVYAFARVRGHAIAHDITLDGNTFANSFSVDKEPLVGDLQVGFILRYDWFETGWYTTWETERFELQDDNHNYGAWMIAAHFTY